MYCYKCAIFREHKMPGIKPFTNEELLFTRLYTIYLLYLLSLLALLLMSIMFLKTYTCWFVSKCVGDMALLFIYI
jgi:hypothetical protein